MQFDIQYGGVAAATPLSDHIRRRLGFGLARHGTRVARVQVRVNEAIAPTRDAQGWCRIRIHLVDASPVVVQDLGPDLHAVIDRCSDRAARSVAIRLGRSHFGRQDLNPAPLPALGDVPQRVSVTGFPRRRVNRPKNTQSAG